jgi:hypothetical protein
VKILEKGVKKKIKNKNKILKNLNNKKKKKKKIIKIPIIVFYLNGF